MTFKNLPTEKKEEISKITENTETKNDIKAIVSFGIKGFIVITVIAFISWKMFFSIKELVQAKDEILFAVQHPQLVKPIRELYTLSHQKADEDLKQILTGGKE